MEGPIEQDRTPRGHATGSIGRRAGSTPNRNRCVCTSCEAGDRVRSPCAFDVHLGDPFKLNLGEKDNEDPLVCDGQKHGLLMVAGYSCIRSCFFLAEHQQRLPNGAFLDLNPCTSNGILINILYLVINHHTTTTISTNFLSQQKASSPPNAFHTWARLGCQPPG